MVSPDWQQRFVVIIFKVGASLSLMGTGFVMHEVLTDKKKRSKVYFRLLFGLSFMEFVESLVLFCGTWCTPSDWTWWGASGNEATCKLQGFLNQFSIGSSLYSGFLAMYYLLAIRYNVVERKIRKHYEPWMHFISISWSLGTSIAALAVDTIRPIGSICYIGKTEKALMYLYTFYYSWFFFSFFFTLVAMILVWFGIRRQESRMVRYDASARSVAKGRDMANRNLSRRFAVQGTLYVVVMWICNVWTVINFTRIQLVGKGYIQISMIASVIKPLEGFLNTLIYIRPRIIAKRDAKKKQLATSAAHAGSVVSNTNMPSNTGSTHHGDEDDSPPLPPKGKKGQKNYAYSSQIGGVVRMSPSAGNTNVSESNPNEPPPESGDSSHYMPENSEAEFWHDAEEQRRLGAY